jgi:hypothetical protein
MQDMRKDIPNLEIKVIDECDHWMIVENPEAVDEALGEFLDTIKVIPSMLRMKLVFSKINSSFQTLNSEFIYF